MAKPSILIWTGMLAVMFIAIDPQTVLSGNEIKAYMTWGQETRQSIPFYIELATQSVDISNSRHFGLEADEISPGLSWKTTAGNGDVDGIELTLLVSDLPIQKNDSVHPFWRELFRLSDPDTARRLQQDAAHRNDPRSITVRTNPEGTEGFSFTMDQLLTHRSLWVPAFDLYITADDPPVSFEQHRQKLEQWEGARILDQTAAGPEASLEQFTARWEDMGSPSYHHASQPAPGHIVGLTWDSAIYKFGIDRWAGVWNDYGNPDRFRFWFDVDDTSGGIRGYWKNQSLMDGLPIITTTFNKESIQYEIEQFAFPLDGPPGERRGDIAMVLLHLLRSSNLSDKEQTVSLSLHHQRKIQSGNETPENLQIAYQRQGDRVRFYEQNSNRVLFTLEGGEFERISFSHHPIEKQQSPENSDGWYEIQYMFSVSLDPEQTREWIIKFPSPMLESVRQPTLDSLQYDSARSATIEFWTEWNERGARFHAPEPSVNDLFRANLWHALRLPRRHGGEEESVRIDIPYSNFAYDQNGIPWPVNQAVYVDYMIYNLRGYHEVSGEELLAMYRENQEENGHIRGYANWGVYTPAMMYATAKHFLLSHDRRSFDRLLPYTLKSLDWLLQEIRKANARMEDTKGLIRSPLNDLTGEGIWAFTQAYVYAGLNTLGQALTRIDHPRASECLDSARRFRDAVIRAFGKATVHAPVVQLRDQTWMPYVPCEVLTPRRLLEQWYPTDVDTGATHLLRLQALPAEGWMAEALLNDHEDNLYIHGWGMANEPVYNPQATAYLLRDDPQAVIRAFYSYIACAFSHRVLEPVEHRWFWGQYFGPPSTDGAWFELYRNMLIHEIDANTLVLMQATPRAWLEDGKRIEVERAPTYFGDISLLAASRSKSNQIEVRVEMPTERMPKMLLVRLRHPEEAAIRSVSINGEEWEHYDVEKEWIIVKNPNRQHYTIIATY